MFASALESVIQYTYPLVISQRFYDGSVDCGIATFIILNEEGWMLTSAHVLGALHSAQKHAKEITEYENKKTEIMSNTKARRWVIGSIFAIIIILLYHVKRKNLKI